MDLLFISVLIFDKMETHMDDLYSNVFEKFSDDPKIMFVAMYNIARTPYFFSLYTDTTRKRDEFDAENWAKLEF